MTGSMRTTFRSCQTSWRGDVEVRDSIFVAYQPFVPAGQAGEGTRVG
jgi:hypothetical protein